MTLSLKPLISVLMPAYNYYMDRNNGVAFQDGGIGGMLAARGFKTLLLPAETTSSFDHGSLDNYQQLEQVEDYRIFALKNQNASPL